MYITTNLPVNKKWTGIFYYVPLDPAKGRFAVEFEMPKTGTIKMAKAAIGRLMQCDPKCVSFVYAACLKMVSLKCSLLVTACNV